jgi:hypothetical protein
MSLANALILAASSAFGGGVVAFVFTVWLAHREMAAMRDEFNDERGRLTSENGVLRTMVRQTEARATHAELERDTINADNLRMHKTLRRHQVGRVA